jgi:hypothetical protein
VMRASAGSDERHALDIERHGFNIIFGNTSAETS